MRQRGITLLFFAIIMAGWASGARAAGGKMELVSVAPDKWTFVKKPSGERFIPFGANLVVGYPIGSPRPHRGLNILVQKDWDPQAIRQIFLAVKSLNMNVLKVFLPSYMVTPDPQTNERVNWASMTPPLFERLDYLFAVARETGVYVSLTYAEWGLTHLSWWNDGGTFMGRPEGAGPGIDSRAVLRNFWTEIAKRYKDEPALFSYNLSVEFMMPDDNRGGGKGAALKDKPLFGDRWGLPAWHGWLKENLGDAAALNRRWGTQYASIDQAPQPEFEWAGAKGQYTMPQAMLSDYHSFRECVAYAFFKNQVDAIRAVDSKHMITAGLHPHNPATGWAGSAMYHSGIAPAELDLFDYTTVHLYTNTPEFKPGVDPRSLNSAVLSARFAYAGRPMIVEEMGHFVINDQTGEVARETLKLAESLIPHASGLMLWSLTCSGQKRYGPLNEDLSINDFGRQWRKLAEAGGAVAKMPARRTRARKVITVDRLNGLAPVRPTEAQKLLDNWEQSPLPVDIRLEPDPMLEKMRRGQR